jgi:hypothetical protein
MPPRKQPLASTPGALPIASAPFAHHVSRIVCRRSQEQVIGPDAWRVVAVVTDEHAIRDRAVGQLPYNAVRHVGLMGANANRPVPEGRRGAGPHPTPLRSLDLFPEAVSQGAPLNAAAGDSSACLGAEARTSTLNPGGNGGEWACADFADPGDASSGSGYTASNGAELTLPLLDDGREGEKIRSALDALARDGTVTGHRVLLTLGVIPPAGCNGAGVSARQLYHDQEEGRG